MRFTITLAALAATVAFASPALAQQASANATAKGLVLEPLTLTKYDDLDFGTVAGDPSNPGTVVLDVSDPLNPTRTKTGAITLVPSPWQPARFDGMGDPGTSVVLTLSPPSVLLSGSNSIAVNSMVFDTCDCTNDTRTIGTTGAFTVYVGGDFAIGTNQANGLYSATFSVTADYQ
jgi:hypothetical protein